jgi:uncharacterized protein YbjT (DUF2867 family)
MATRHRLKVLVSGAHLRPGAAAARLLHERGHDVRLLTLQPEGERAKALEDLGIEIAPVAPADRAGLQSALTGVEAVFAVGPMTEVGPGGAQLESTQLVDAARESNLRHFVYCSAASADRAMDLPYFGANARVEERLRSAKLPHTIVAPVFFMENFATPPMHSWLREGELRMALPPRRKLQHVSVTDVARFSAFVLEHPAQLLGRRLELASDNLDGEETAAALSEAIGSPIRYVEEPLDALRGRNEERARIFEHLDRVGYRADPAALRRQYPHIGWRTTRAWAGSVDWRAVMGAPSVAPTLPGLVAAMRGAP